MAKKMSRHDYLEWMFRTLEAEATEAEQQALQQWLNEAPENRKLFAEVEKIWQAARSQTPKSVPNVHAAWQKVAARIQIGESARVIPFRPRKVALDTLFFSRILPVVSAAAAVLILALYGGYRLSLPEYYELAVLTQSEQKNLSPETRGDLSVSPSKSEPVASSKLKSKEPSASKSEFAPKKLLNQPAKEQASEHQLYRLRSDSSARAMPRKTRGEPSASQSEFTRGAKALWSAQQKKWGIIPYFNPQQVMEAITHLQNAFAQTADPVSRNKYAFYLGKAYLMQEDVSSARQWLNKVLTSEAVAYLDEANRLLDRLPPN